MKERYAGILLPITALPSPYGVGSFGKEAREFVDFLARSGQKIWPVLPLVPTGYGDSPYSSSCATAGNPYFIDIDTLIDRGLQEFRPIILARTVSFGAILSIIGKRYVRTTMLGGLQG